MQRIEPVIQHYAWGSHDEIARILGRPSDGTPWAEAWFGAHPLAPATLPDGSNLADMIADDLEGTLGPDVAREFGGLPFLLKILSADQPLSIQTHPSREQARKGFGREIVAGITIDDPHRLYKDRNHKPELICALTEFEALCGFREVEAIAADFTQVGGPMTLWAGFLREHGIAATIGALFATADPAELCNAFASSNLALPWLDGVRALYPADLGVVVALMLNHLVLNPGDALYLDAGNVHAYLRGTGIELMANSDNVLRAGLTPKHIDAEELVNVMVPDAAPIHVQPNPDGSYVTPCPDFELSVITNDDRRFPAAPSIILVTAGSVAITTTGATSADSPISLEAGQSAFITQSDGPTTITPTTPETKAWRASIPK
jgi:mannose-6-phosphate isomerase